MDPPGFLVLTMTYEVNITRATTNPHSFHEPTHHIDGIKPLEAKPKVAAVSAVKAKRPKPGTIISNRL